MTILDDIPYNYPPGREALKHSLATLADEETLRRIILEGPLTEAEEWLWEDLIAVFPVPENANEQIRLTLRSREEATAIQRVRDAFDEVARSIRDKTKDENWILHPHWPAVTATAANALALPTTDDEPPPPPSRADVIQVLKLLADGDAGERDAGRWAARWTEHRQPRDVPPEVWEALKLLASWAFRSDVDAIRRDAARLRNDLRRL